MEKQKEKETNGIEGEAIEKGMMKKKEPRRCRESNEKEKKRKEKARYRCI